MRTTGIIVTLFALLSTVGSLDAQNRMQVEKALKSTGSYHALDSLQRSNNRWEIFGEVLSASDTTNFPFLLNPVVGEIYKVNLENRNNQNYLVKIMHSETQQLCRVEYIYLDGEQLKMREIDSIRSEIHRRVQRGEKFSDMIDHYNMDGSSGDMGWFGPEMVVPAFYKPIIAKEKGEIFDLNIKEDKGYYVIHKTHADLIRKYFYTIWIRFD